MTASHAMRGLLFSIFVSTGNSQDLQIRVWHSVPRFFCVIQEGNKGFSCAFGDWEGEDNRSMAKDKIKVLFDGNTSIDEVRKRLEKVGAEVKPKGGKSFIVKYNNTDFNVEKGKEGWRAGVKIPVYAFFIILALISIVLFFLKGNGNMNADSFAYGIGSAIGTGLVPAVILYWIFAEVYNGLKKKRP